MKKTANARIKDVNVGINFTKAISCTFSLALDGDCVDWSFNLSKSCDVEKLTQLLNYVGVSDVSDLNEKVIRVVINEDLLYALGDPIKDTFFKVSGDFATGTYDEIA